MKKLPPFLGLLVITFSFVKCSMMSDTGLKPNEFLITGELVYISHIYGQVQDLSVKVTYDSAETGIEELASGKLIDGKKIELRGTLEFPKEVTLRVVTDDNIDDAGPLRLCPNSRTNIEVLMYGRYPFVYLKGYYHSSADAENKFTITGDLSKFGAYHPELTYVWVEGRNYELDGSLTQSSYRSVLLDNGKFSIEGDIDEPMGVYIGIVDRFHADEVFPGLTAIIEPGVNYEIGKLGNTEKLVVLADREGIHSKLITDWNSDPEHLELLEQQSHALEELIETLNSEDDTNRGLDSNMEDNEKPTKETPASTFADRNPPSDECNHVDLSFVPDDTSTYRPMTEWDELNYKIQDRRIEYFLPIIQNDDDLQLSWLAYKLSSLDWRRGDDPVFGGPHSDGILFYNSFTYELDRQKIAVLEELATKFSPKFVEVHITPRLESARHSVSMHENNKKVIPGQPAPPFALVTTDGDSVSLESVLQENELVLLNFWNTWCESCAASVPTLKELYSAYHEAGFEVITVHLSSNKYPVRKNFEENDFPWLDVIDSEDSELKGWEAPIKTSYSRIGLGSIVYEPTFFGAPHGFLIDNKGCIVGRNISTEELETALVSRWSVKSSE